MWTKARALAALMPREPATQATVAVEFKTPLFLPARASLWTTREMSGRSAPEAQIAHRTHFEVRDAGGDRPHLRGYLSVSRAEIET
jgi:hypothetical protein